MGRYRNVQSSIHGATSSDPSIRVFTHNPWCWRYALFTALLLFLPLAPAQASATYQWRSASEDGCCEALLEITDEAAAAGAVGIHIQQTGAPQAFAGNPVIRFLLTGYGDRIVFDRDHVRGVYDFDVTLAGGSLSGRIRVNDLSTDTLLVSGPGAGDQWTVKEHHADHPGDCFQAENKCSGAMGNWVLVSPSTD